MQYHEYWTAFQVSIANRRSKPKTTGEFEHCMVSLFVQEYFFTTVHCFRHPSGSVMCWLSSGPSSFPSLHGDLKTRATLNLCTWEW